MSLDMLSDGRKVSILAHPERWALLMRATMYERGLPFQSSPTPKGGRYKSIRAVLFWPKCFNPRPPRKVGATCSGHRFDGPFIVSILAHPERWALRYAGDYVRTGLAVSILAHPERWALPAAPVFADTRAGCFNPRPPRKVGATSAIIHAVSFVSSFNPRPPRKVGATHDVSGIARHINRFNPRPPRKVGATLAGRHDRAGF